MQSKETGPSQASAHNAVQSDLDGQFGEESLHVAESERRGWWPIACIWIGNAFNVSTLMTGAVLGAGLVLSDAFLAAFIGFAMGTSWGTAALILPIVLGVFPESDPLFLVTIGATLAGAVYGDHISPISDTTILSSAGAECNHLRHVATQLPYASLVAVICLFGYLVAGFTGSPWPSLIGGIAVALVVVIATRVFGNKEAA